MKTIEKTKRDLPLEDYKQRFAQERDFSELIQESTTVTENGKVMIVYLELGDALDSTALTNGLRSIKYDTGYRTLGLKSTSRTLGFQPRLTIRRDYCTATRLATEQPDVHALVCDFAAQADAYYRQYNPDLHTQHEEKTKNVLAEYTIKNSVFTSGIINKDNQLMYHFDKGNFDEVWSNMLVFKHRISGGYLAVPQYDIGFELKKNSLFMFDGQGLLHGVTPFKKHGPEAYRFSIVYYSLRQMWNCEPIDDELIRIRHKKAERERKRVQLHKEFHRENPDSQ